MLATLLLAVAMLEPAAGARTPEPVLPPLHTRGRHVVDSLGRRVLLACVNWYGAHLDQLVMNGLNRQPVDRIAGSVVDMGFNCVRLPFSLEMIFTNRTQVPDPNTSLAANPELMDMTALEIFDATVASLTKRGVMVILNNHVSENGWCCSLTDGQGLWYTHQYPEDAWLRGIGIMAARYRSNPLVVGFDLRNELRPSILGNPNWGSGNNHTDWSVAAVKGAQKVLEQSNDMLIIISGIFFSTFLCDVPFRPIHMDVPALRGRTLYTSHEYRWFNFHLTARTVVKTYLATVVAWWAVLWLAALAWHMGKHRCPGVSRRCAACWRLCPSCCPPVRCELAIALGLTSGSLILLLTSRIFWDKCGMKHLMLSMACLFLAFLGCVVSLVLWMRLAVNSVRWSQEQWQELGPSTASLTAGGQADMLTHPFPESRDCSLRPRNVLCRATNSKNCLAFVVSGMVLGALICVCNVYGRYETFTFEVDHRWGFLANGGAGDEVDGGAAPVWLGEFGSAEDNLWWSMMTSYIMDREVVGWAYWSLNGQRTNQRREPFGLLEEDAATIRFPWMVESLQRMVRHFTGAPCAPLAAASKAAEPPEQGSCRASRRGASQRKTAWYTWILD